MESNDPKAGKSQSWGIGALKTCILSKLHPHFLNSHLNSVSEMCHSLLNISDKTLKAMQYSSAPKL